MPIHDEALEASRLHALTQQLPVGIEPEEIFKYTEDGLESLRPNVLYIPRVTNHTAINLFILADDFIYFFQTTVASTHDINHLLIDVAKKLHFPGMYKCRFVFIMPPNLALTVPQLSKGPLQNISLYPAVVDPLRFNGSSIVFRW